MLSAIGIIFGYQRFQFGELGSLSLLFPPTRRTNELWVSNMKSIRMSFGTRSSFIWWKVDPLIWPTIGRPTTGPFIWRCFTRALTWRFSPFVRNSNHWLNSGLEMTFRSEISASLMLTCLKQSPKRDQREWVRESDNAEVLADHFSTSCEFHWPRVIFLRSCSIWKLNQHPRLSKK